MAVSWITKFRPWSEKFASLLYCCWDRFFISVCFLVIVAQTEKSPHSATGLHRQRDDVLENHHVLPDAGRDLRGTQLPEGQWILGGDFHHRYPQRRLGRTAVYRHGRSLEPNDARLRGRRQRDVLDLQLPRKWTDLRSNKREIRQGAIKPVDSKSRDRFFPFWPTGSERTETGSILNLSNRLLFMSVPKVFQRWQCLSFMSRTFGIQILCIGWKGCRINSRFFWIQITLERV